MCLTILEKTKKRVALNDILVYKCLDYDTEYGYSTPFQYFPIYFAENGRYRMNVKNFTYSHNRKNVDEGIHAYYDKKIADDTSECFADSRGTKTHYAIIPNGTKYYIGNSGDVVSTELIIFKTLEDYKKYKKSSEKICIIDEYSLSLQEI